MARDLGLDDVVDHFTLIGDELEQLRNKSGATRLGFAVRRDAHAVPPCKPLTSDSQQPASEGSGRALELTTDPESEDLLRRRRAKLPVGSRSIVVLRQNRANETSIPFERRRRRAQQPNLGLVGPVDRIAQSRPISKSKVVAYPRRVVLWITGRSPCDCGDRTPLIGSHHIDAARRGSSSAASIV